jgi:uncharacterized protein (PEP-CTERM system associated)
MASNDRLLQRRALAAAVATGLLSPMTCVAQGAAAGATAGIVPIGVGEPAGGERRAIRTGVSASLLASDNPDLQPAGQERSGTLFELTPFVEASLANSRGVGEAYYGLRGQVRDGGTDPRDEIRHDLRAWTDLRLTDETLRLYASASVYDVSASAFGAGSSDPAASRTNRAQYRDVLVSPYLLGRVDGDGSWRLQPSARHVDPGTDTPSSATLSIEGEARSDLVRRRIGASVRGQAYEVDYAGPLSYAGADADVLGWWRAASTLRLGLGVGWSRNDLLRNADGENSGVGPTASFEWTPQPRAAVRGTWSDRYWGHAAELDAQYRAQRWNLGLTARRGLSDGNASNLFAAQPGPGSAARAAGTSAPAGGDAVDRTLADRGLARPGGSGFGSGLIDSPLVYTDTLVASLGLTGPRSAVLASLFVNDRRTAVPFAGGPVEDVDQRGATLDASYRLDGRNALRLSAAHTVSESVVDDSRATLTSLWLFWDLRLGARSSANLGGRVQRQRGDGITVEYDEAAAFVSLDYRF